MSLDSGQIKIARKAIERGFPPSQVARIVGVDEVKIRAQWAHLVPRRIGDGKSKIDVAEFSDGSASVWTPRMVVIPQRLSCRAIAEVCAAYFEHSYTTFMGPSQKWPLVHQRQMSMLLCRKLLEEPTKSIGKFFGRDHSTVVHAMHVIRQKIDDGPPIWRHDYVTLKRALLDALGEKPKQ